MSIAEMEPSEMMELYSRVMACASVLPMKKPPQKGLAKVLNPNPGVEIRGYLGLTPFMYEPPASLEPGVSSLTKPSLIDSYLEHNEVHCSMLGPTHDPLGSVEEWMDALQLRPDSKMRTNGRFRRVLEELSHPTRYTIEQKYGLLDGFKYGFTFDPELAGVEESAVGAEGAQARA